MASTIHSRDARSLMQSHRELIRTLNDALSRTKQYQDEAAAEAKRLLDRNLFEQSVAGALHSGLIPARPPEELGRLLSLLRAWEDCALCTGKARDQVQANQDGVLLAMRNLSPAANGVRWLFAGRQSREKAALAYEYLARLLGSGYAQGIRDAVAETKAAGDLDPAAALCEFPERRGRYRTVLQQCCPHLAAMGKPVQDVQALIQRHQYLRDQLARAETAEESLKKAVRGAADAVIESEVRDILRTIPVEDINRELSGIRVKALTDSGYHTMADIRYAEYYALAAVRGISEETAGQLMRYAHECAQRAKKTASIRVSADQRSPEATRLLQAVFMYKEQRDSLASLHALREAYGSKAPRAMKRLETVGNGSQWHFMEPQEQKKILEAYAYLDELRSSEYGSTLPALAEALSDASLPAQDAVWADFIADSIAYFQILEDLCPGAMSSYDKRYGLPDELAHEIQKVELDLSGLGCSLRRYQEWGTKYIIHQQDVLLGDEMGLGKTVQAIAAMVDLRNVGATHFMVVCPASVLPNWMKEITEKSDIPAVKLHGPNRIAALSEWMERGGAAVTTYETTSSLDLDEDFMMDLIVVDEAHYIKNPEALRTISVRKLCRQSRRRLFMTGTALENRVEEMISLVNTLQPDTAAQLQNIAFMASAPQFRQLAAPVYYRRKREEVLTELPELIESKEWCSLSPEEEEVYEKTILSRNFAAIRQVSWNVPDLRDSSKARRMLEIIEEAADDGRKVIVFSFFLNTLRKAAALLGERCVGPITGSVPPARRQQILDEFEKAPEGTVLLSQIQSGGTGLNIQAASVVILCEPQFKPSIENQAISRAYRMGQARNVLVYRLLCEDTADEKLIRLLAEKQTIFDTFADQSEVAQAIAREDVELDETTFGQIVEEEAQRIQEKKKQ